jgi:uroporphyrinogen-III decarboxylase
MTEKMSPFERFEAAFRMEETDRVPVAPIHNYLVPYVAGLTIWEEFFEPEKLVQALLDNRDLIADFQDSYVINLNHMSFLGRSGWDQTTLDWRIYEHYPPKGNVPNLFEKPIIEDYDDVFERGFAPILFNRKLGNRVWERSIDDFLYFQYDYKERLATAMRGFVEETGVPLLKGGRACHPLDLLQYYRGIYNLTMDIYERPEKVKQFCDWIVEYECFHAMDEAMIMGAGEVPGADVIFYVNGGPPGMSPGIYEEFYWPYAKKMVDILVTRGFKVWNHWDNDHTHFLDTIKTITDGLPKGKIVMDLEKTDMKKAKEVLGSTACIYGNVPSAMLVYGSTEEVDDYCRQLIEDCAEGGGFFLGGECEVPWDSKVENIHTMIKAAEKYGRYYGDPAAAEPKGITEGGRKLLAEIKAGLNPPTLEELDRVTAGWLFGTYADKMMRHAPWSFVLTKVMWKRGEEPWEA